MGSTTFSGAVTSTNGFVGALTGNVTGNITGDVTGDVTGNLTGDVTGNLAGATVAATTSITTGTGGIAVKAIKSSTIAVDLANCPSGESIIHDATLTGAAAGDIVILVPPADLTTQLIFSPAYVSAADTVSVVVANLSGAAINESSADWVYIWYDLT